MTIYLGSPLPVELVRPTWNVTDGQSCSCLALLRMGFTEPPWSPRALVVSYTTVSPLPVPSRAIGGLLSVALSVGFPRLDVIQHPALWSPDFPQPVVPAAVISPARASKLLVLGRGVVR